ncbi:hypothetical protein CKN99_05400 [Carnobacterium maltaromaticum]|uniref:hypothetical protein n=1 Tax=Carnobacterium maltaromaticum TaxID=2751 RepID=UPI000704FAFD|nr:hypothetical protein [Carnobacterium maltaromaticum]KRN85132.1 hypothetical protein IV75_GL003287 [Carnobacterium maltaromaticum]MDT1945586.1 hypothetical protein [Carnobacterium maltaromaticum]MDT2000090.1 hypothetical protein [Carnobacterium maltaromaticum]TFJ29381.1 hypothetical protein CKN90_05395 [Carnobacterium maltaromaticum]TFJ33550.1 hypothetical protein CKN98_05400 [Carnobacterium maltaromaticum]
MQTVGKKKKYHDALLTLRRSWDRMAEILGVEIDFYNTEFDQKQTILKIKIVDVQKIKINIPPWFN